MAINIKKSNKTTETNWEVKVVAQNCLHTFSSIILWEANLIPWDLNYAAHNLADLSSDSSTFGFCSVAVIPCNVLWDDVHWSR
ncbi:hypothetical protein PanWU01x14_025720 [Parasponia andersonii]|uniref:Uncharacterized protein n=1 Tax=Parasponia andersonii TaxID=3476 RepID=A0A2P5DWZ0_PARAD|nr:hypothetical protein PanWU01x14_025720 [Parasponia andersonii]